MAPGYAYKFTGKGKWRESVDDDWEIQVPTVRGARFVGFRSIDGTRCTVWETKKGIFAQTEAAAPAPRGMRAKR